MKPQFYVPTVLSSKSYIQKVLNIQPANLIGYWPLNEASGTTADNAEGTAARDATYSSDVSTWPVAAGVGDGNTAPIFDGSNDFINLATASLGTAGISDSLTIALLAKVSGSGIWTDGNLHDIIKFTYSTATDYLRILKSTTNNRLTFQGEWGNGGAVIIHRDTSSSTAWMHLALTMSVSSDQLIGYYNGSAVGSPGSGLLTQSDTTLDTVRTLLGADDVSTPATLWSGQMAHVAIWTTVLTPAEIATLATV